MFYPLAHNVQLERDQGFAWRFAALVLAGLALLAYWQNWVISPFPWDLAIVLTFVFGYRTFSRAFQDLFSRRISADQAVTLAALAALYVGEYLAAAEVVYIMLVGETLEDYAARRFRGDLNRLLSCLPHHAHVLRGDKEEKVHLEEIQHGERVVVYPGARIPVDGEVLEGESLVDESSITGEAVSRERLTGEKVYAGTLNQTGRLVISANQVGDETVLNRIVELVKHARERKGKVQRTADRYARWFLPLVIVLAGLCYLLTGDWMRSVAVLIVACPCAMVLSTPAAVLASISALARRGIVVKGGLYLEKLAEVDCIAFDKTGTLTRGKPELINVVSFNGFNETAVLASAASVERHSEHLLAKSIRASARERDLSLYPTRNVSRHAGLGMEGSIAFPPSSVASSASGPEPEPVREERVLIGSLRFMEQRGIQLSHEETSRLEDQTRKGRLAVLVAWGNQPAGALILSDQPRPESASTLHELHHLGIHKTLLLTGDHESSAEDVGKAVGISHIDAELLPQDKLDRLESLKRQGYTVAMVGDGVNDSPSLATADVGIAMGDTGTDIAADAAGVVLMGERGLQPLPELIRTSRRALQTIHDNIFWFGLMFNLAAVLLAFFGYLSAVAAAVVHQVSSFLVLMNSLKLLRKEPAQLIPRPLRRLLHQADHWREHLQQPGSLDPLRERAKEHLQPLLLTAGLLTAGLYLLSGVQLIGPDEAALVQRFGKVQDRTLTPGLHYTLPWPVDRVLRIQPQRVKTLTLGFRLVNEPTLQEPAAYEWNLQHRLGRHRRQDDEAVMLTGDEYLVEVNAVVQYSIQNPSQYLFQASDIEALVPALAEGILRSVVATASLDEVLALERSRLEFLVLSQLRQRITDLELGLQIHSVNLQDVHPALEVVSSFREVASALEEKNRMMNLAEAYAQERLPLARGTSQERLIDALSYRVKKSREASGEAARFNNQYDAFLEAPTTTKVRLYLESIEKGLAGKNKYILDQGSGRRRVTLFKSSVFDLGDFEKAIGAAGGSR